MRDSYIFVLKVIDIISYRYYTSVEVIYLIHCSNIHDIGNLGRTYLQNKKKGRFGRDSLVV